MGAPCTEPAEAAAIRHEIGSTVVETVRRTDGWFLYHCPEILPVNARCWRGHFESERAAIADFIEKTRIPRITPSRLQLLKRYGHHSVVDGKELILRLDPLTGAIVLTSFELATDKRGR
jgi:hypothetical protein